MDPRHAGPRDESAVDRQGQHYQIWRHHLEDLPGATDALHGRGSGERLGICQQWQPVPVFSGNRTDPAGRRPGRPGAHDGLLRRRGLRNRRHSPHGLVDAAQRESAQAPGLRRGFRILCREERPGYFWMDAVRWTQNQRGRDPALGTGSRHLHPRRERHDHIQTGR